MRIIAAVTGASGSLYALRFLLRAVDLGAEIDLIVSPAGGRVARAELGFALEPARGELEAMLHERAARVRKIPAGDIGAEAASGSVPFDGMVIIPCSMGTVGRIANGIASTLIERAADVTLKEGRPLVVVPRETPFNRIHLTNLTALHDAGARIVPAMPAFYAGADSVEALVDTVVDRALAPIFGTGVIRSRWHPEANPGEDA